MVTFLMNTLVDDKTGKYFTHAVFKRSGMFRRLWNDAIAMMFHDK